VRVELNFKYGGQHIKSHAVGNLDAVLEAGKGRGTVLLPTHPWSGFLLKT